MSVVKFLFSALLVNPGDNWFSKLIFPKWEVGVAEVLDAVGKTDFSFFFS